MNVVFDSSTLILLAKTDLLRDVSEEVDIIIPETVKKDCLVKKTVDAELISILIQTGKINVHEAVDTKAIKKLQVDFRIARAEAEALWLSRKYHHPIALDDGPEIKASKVLGLQFLTAIHFLIHLTSHNRLPRDLAQEKLLKLAKMGRYNTRIIEDAMNRVQEGKK